MVIKHKARKYTPDQIVRRSHYSEPINKSPGRPAGNSRIWGDAPREVQIKVIDAIVKEAKLRGLTRKEAAYLLAIVMIESGFNPDAAAGTTSAAGLGQLTNDTRVTLKVNEYNKFDVTFNTAALVKSYSNHKELLTKQGIPIEFREDMIYVMHHDGSRGSSAEGLSIARNRFIPSLIAIEQALSFEFFPVGEK